MSIGFTEILLVAVVVLLLFGAKRIPELAKAIGRASGEFKKAKEELAREGREFASAAESAAKADAAKGEAGKADPGTSDGPSHA